ncbi:MAG: integrase [Anaerolineae bacterium]
MATEKLDLEEGLKVLRMQRGAYRAASRTGKGRILDALEAVTGLSRKTIIRHLNGSCQRKRRRKGRDRSYGPDVDDAQRIIYQAYDGICVERLTPNLVAYAEELAQHGHLRMTPALREQLGRISVSTVRRILQRIRQDEPRRQRRPGLTHSGLRAGVPAGRIPWDEATPGHLEVDLVHHCGRRAGGEYVHTLHLVDVASGWSEMAAVLGRSYLAMADGFQRCAQRLPLPVLEIHPDNGSEFFNAHLVQFFGELFTGARLSRSRPWQKNDNRFVEHRNGALIRGWVGHDRLDSVMQVLALNAFYEKLRIYHNLFQPVMRLTHKTYDRETQRVRRCWDAPRTPFQRLLASGAMSSAEADELQRLYDRTDPLTLRQELEADIRAIFALPGAQAGRSEKVFATLLPSHPMYTPKPREEEALLLGDVFK